jgi:hypothetical protein
MMAELNHELHGSLRAHARQGGPTALRTWFVKFVVYPVGGT